ncbi:hypothetical protein [Haloplanus rubicundus]|nr:hypothetical protein [Haloplanus rubicundus]
MIVTSSWWSQRGRAQATEGSGGGGGSSISSAAIADAVTEALKSLLRALFSPIEGLIETHANSLLQLIVGTPAPQTVVDTPRTLPWTTLYDFYWSTIVPLALLLFGLAVGLVILLEATSHLFSSYHRTNLKRRAFSGLMGILAWWWLAALSLQVTDQLVTLLLPDLSSVSLFQTLSFTGIGLLGLVATLSIDALLFGLLALVYLGRQLLLYGFVLGMPLLIAAWIPGVGPFALISRFAKRLAGFYVPFLLMPVPVAVLLRLGALLGDAATLSMGGLGAWLTALVIPFVAIISPFVLVWQASGLLFVGDRLGRRFSRDQARRRAASGRAAGGRLQQRGQRTVQSLRSRARRGATAATDGESRGGTRRGAVRRGLQSVPNRLGSRFRTTDTDETAERVAEPIRFEPNEYETTGRDETTTDDRTDD